MKLNVGCGARPKKGYTNIDIQSAMADIKADAGDLPFDKESVDVIESYHLIEHIDKKVAEAAIIHWYSLLKRGGLLVIECPDTREIARQYLKGNDEMLYSIYGRNRYPYDTHCWGYSRESLCSLLESIGFKNVAASGGTDYHAKQEPCMRVEATK